MKKLPGEIIVTPPRPGACPICATRHAKDQPHELRSLYFQVMFYRRHRRFPTEEDAKANASGGTDISRNP